MPVDVGGETTNTLKRMAGKVGRGVMEASKSIIDALIQQMREAQREKDEKKYQEKSGLMELEEMKKRDKRLSQFTVPDEDIEHLKVLMKQQGVRYYIFDIQNDDGKIVYFPESQRELVKQAISIQSAERGLMNEVNSQAFLQAHKGEEFSVIGNLDEVDLELLRHHARKTDVVFATVGHDEKYKILTDTRNREKLERILSEYVGKESVVSEIREQVRARIDEQKKIRASIDDPDREVYILSASNPTVYLHLSPEEFEYCKGGNQVCSVDRTEFEFRDMALTKLEAITEPVLMTKEEYDSFLEKFNAAKVKEPIPENETVEEKTARIEKDREKVNAYQTIIDEKVRLFPKDINMDKVHSQEAPSKQYSTREMNTSRISTLEGIIKRAEKKAEQENAKSAEKSKSRDFEK